MLQSENPAQDRRPIGLREKAKAKIYQRIQDAAFELFFEFDYNEVTTKAIAQRAGVGEATLFRYVASKKDLLAIVYGNHLSDLVDQLEEADDLLAEQPIMAELVLQRIYALYEGRSQFYLSHPENAARYLRQSYDLTSEGRIHAMEQGDRLVRRVSGILQAAQEAGIVILAIDVSAVALNCHSIFLHEVNRGSTRGFDPQTIWERVLKRINVQLLPIIPQLSDSSSVTALVKATDARATLTGNERP